MRKLLTLSVVVVAVAVAPACATKKFVRTEVGNVNSKVDTLGTSLEQTQERTKQNEGRIAAVDTKAEAAGKSAEAAGRSAENANKAAGDARTAADAAANQAKAVGAKVDTVAADLAAEVSASRKIVYQVTLSEDQGNFQFGGIDLPEAARARLDQVIGDLKADPKAIFIEIEGHTDNVGSKELNQKLGLERAEAVKMYLYTQHQVPLHKINVISYGEDKPVAPNNNRAGRAQNRRVVVRLLS
jgi:outer membrane protein OmpA-like peptidoglycan-associated protein